MRSRRPGAAGACPRSIVRAGAGGRRCGTPGRCRRAGRRGARRGIESSTHPGRHRWVVERSMAWFAVCRRLHRRYERKADHFLAFSSIACTLVCYRRLTK
nr:transposase [Actinacidiphila paucisporea]